MASARAVLGGLLIAYQVLSASSGGAPPPARTIEISAGRDGPHPVEAR